MACVANVVQKKITWESCSWCCRPPQLSTKHCHTKTAAALGCVDTLPLEFAALLLASRPGVIL